MNCMSLCDHEAANERIIYTSREHFELPHLTPKVFGCPQEDSFGFRKSITARKKAVTRCRPEKRAEWYSVKDATKFILCFEKKIQNLKIKILSCNFS